MAKVWVVDLGRTNLALRWHDPVTGAQCQKSAGTNHLKEAERAAAKLEGELDAGRYVAPTRMSWADFRERYEQERLPMLAVRTAETVAASMNHVERILRPRRLADVSAASVSMLSATLRREKYRDVTILGHLARLRAALRWAKRLGFVQQVPEFEMPPRAKGKAMRGRPITAEEFERMLAVVDQVRPDDAEAWRYFLRGLWCSGLRLGEALQLSWESDAPLSVDLTTGRHPRLRICAEAEKGNKDRLLPITPDFAELLAEAPIGERGGMVFKVNGLWTGWQLTCRRAGRIVSEIGKRAGVVVNKDAGKFASAHDFRRAFGTRWSKQLKPAVLMLLMRHESIETTLSYYVELDADEIGDELWKQYATIDRQSNVRVS